MIITVLSVVSEKDRLFLKNCLTSVEYSAIKAGIKLRFRIFVNGTKLSKIHYLKSKVFVITSKSNIGFGNAVNRIFPKINSGWTIIVSPDVITSANCLKNIFPEFLNDNTALIGPRIKLPDGKLQYSVLPIPSIWNILTEQSYLYKLFPLFVNNSLSDYSFYKKMQNVNGIAAIWWLISNRAFWKVSGFDSNFFLYFEDIDLCKRVKIAGFEIIFNPASKVTHLMHQSTGGETNGMLYYKSLRKFLFKHYNKLIAGIAIIVFLTGSLLRLVFWINKYYLNHDRDKKLKANKKIKYFREIINI